MLSRCKAANRDGSPCMAQPVRASGFCFWHCPEVAEQRAAARQRGGANKSSKRRALKAAEGMTVEDIDALLAAVLTGVIVGRFTPGVAKAMIAVREAGAVERIEERLAELERLAVGRSA